MSKGTGIYFDGTTSARHDVSVELTPETLVILDSRGDDLAEWPYADIEHLSAPKQVLRLGLNGEPALARLEIHDPAFAAEIDDRALTVDRSGATDRRARIRVIALSLVATLSLVVVAVFVVPELAARLAPLVPAGVERRLGEAVDAQVRSMLDTRKLGDRLVCGSLPVEQPGQAALEALIESMERAAALPLPLKVSVVRRTEANAIALPGGHVYVFQGLLDKAESPDELAAVIAHEIGHVVHRDGTRSMLQSAGLSLLFGMLLGDFVGGGAVVLAAGTLIRSSYSREVELAADAFGTRLVGRIGGDAAALGTILRRIDGGRKPGVRIWLDHPDVEDRVRAINVIAPPSSRAPLLDAAQWAALRRICAEP
ncbi:MAG: M48 family metalloprotease [Rhizobiales bacterium]|nr:M48 family metalloprotease [Hyphomicrobiales bacterium]